MHPLVLALNPSIDVEWRVQSVHWEEKNQILSERSWAGGKGVNVARWLQHLGSRPRLLLPLGAASGRELLAGLKQERLSAAVLPIREPTRANVIVSTAGGRQLRFNPLGPKLSATEWRTVLRRLRHELKRASMLILSGSLPRGVPENAYAQLLRVAHEAHVTALLDCDGRTLAAAAKARPFLVKPNVHELSQWQGKPLETEASVRSAARAMSEATRGWVLVSQGRQGGFLIHARENRCFAAAAPAGKSMNTIGAGDAMLAAVARQIEQQSAPEEWLHHGVAVGTAATRCVAGHLPSMSFIRRLVQEMVHRPGRKRLTA